MIDQVTNVKKYAKGPVNEDALAKMAKTYQLVLSKADSRYVACSDAEERARIRDNFPKKKLGLSDEALDDAIIEVCKSMKADRLKSRLTFYYLLAEHFDRLDKFA